MIKAPCVWAIAAANIGNNYGWFVLLSWIPKVCWVVVGVIMVLFQFSSSFFLPLSPPRQYFVGNFGVDLSQDPFLAASPYITGE